MINFVYAQIKEQAKLVIGWSAPIFMGGTTY
jgi:hypothetical protein